MLLRVLLVLSSIAAALFVPAFVPLLAQQQQAAPKATVAKPQSDRQKRRNEERLKKELETPYKKWLNEEVLWIITPEERTAFGRLETDDERQQFIEQFWLRRDPTPDSEENELKEEHYRRIAWANDRFASGVPGWKTDRGMVYIKYGPADEREEHPTGGPGVRDIAEGGGQTTFFPYERWRYRYIEGVGQDVIIEFVDASMTNEYRMTWNPSDKDALLRVPGAGLTLYEQMGLADKNDRFSTSNPMYQSLGPLSGTSQMNMFDRLQRFTAVQKAPGIKFKDLDAMVNSTIRYNLLPMQVRVDYIPVTEATVNTSLTIQFNREDLQFRQKEGLAEGLINLTARVQTMTGRRVGRLIEEVLEVRGPAEQLSALQTGKAIFNTTIPLLPGQRYKLTVGAKDVVGDNMVNYDVALNVPTFSENELSVSTLILADQLEKIPTRSTGAGQFVIGSSKVRPKVDETFKRGEMLGIYMQVYNFEADETTQKPQGSVKYEITRNGSNEKVLEFSEDVSALSGGASQMVIEKKLKLDALAPGEYTLQITVTDKKRNETLAPSAKFKVI
jgi:GWxTD domain-containing protein